MILFLCTQACRFHIKYPTYGPWGEEEMALLWDVDAEETKKWDMQWTLDEIMTSDLIESLQMPSGELRRHVELIKADEMLGRFGRLKTDFKCPECEPFITDFSEDSDGICRCDIYEHFVGAWRCIPCVLAEETKSVATEQRFKISYDPEFEYEAFHGGEKGYKYVSRDDTSRPLASSSIVWLLTLSSPGAHLQLWEAGDPTMSCHLQNLRFDDPF